MAEPRGTGLQTIFGFFLGLMVTSFIGVGVYTFYPPADRVFSDRILQVTRQQEQIRLSKAPTDLSPDDRAQLQQLQTELDGLQDERRVAGEAWGRRTSIILIALATVTMAVSLLQAVQLPVISNGLLLGGVFTMVYGVGWIIATDSSTARFFVMTAALGITLGLGYVRFVRQRSGVPSEGVAAATSGGNISDLERRVRALEDKVARVARAFESDQSRGS